MRETTGAPVSSPRTDHRGIHVLVDRPRRGVEAVRIEWSRLNGAGGHTFADFVD